MLFHIIRIHSVSSVLNKDVKQHGKTFMFDGLEDTAWYSDQVMVFFYFYSDFDFENNS